MAGSQGIPRFRCGHISPEAYEGGPLVLLKDGDRTTIDAESKTIDVDLTQDSLIREKLGQSLSPRKKRAVSQHAACQFLHWVDRSVDFDECFLFFTR